MHEIRNEWTKQRARVGEREREKKKPTRILKMLNVALAQAETGSHEIRIHYIAYVCTFIINGIPEELRINPKKLLIVKSLAPRRNQHHYREDSIRKQYARLWRLNRMTASASVKKSNEMKIVRFLRFNWTQNGQATPVLAVLCAKRLTRWVPYSVQRWQSNGKEKTQFYHPKCARVPNFYVPTFLFSLLASALAVWFPSFSYGTLVHSSAATAASAAAAAASALTLRLIYPLTHIRYFIRRGRAIYFVRERRASSTREMCCTPYVYTSDERTPNRLAAVCMHMDGSFGWLAKARWSLLAVPLAFPVRRVRVYDSISNWNYMYVCDGSSTHTHTYAITEYHRSGYMCALCIYVTFCIRKRKSFKRFFSLSVRAVCPSVCVLYWLPLSPLLCCRRHRYHLHHCLRCCCCCCRRRCVLQKEEKIFGWNWCACSFLIPQNMYMYDWRRTCALGIFF